MFEKEITFDRFVRGLLIFLSIVLVVVAVSYLSSVLVPFIVAWFIAYLIFPLVHFFQYKLHLHFRILSILVTLAFICGIVYGLVAISMPSITYETVQFKEASEKFIKNGISNKSIPPTVQDIVNTQVKNLNLDKLISHEDVVNLIKGAAPRVWNVIYQTANALITIIASLIALLYLFFILFDYEKIYKGFLRMVPRKRRPFVTSMMRDMSNGMSNYFRGQAIISLCVGLLFCTGFLIIGFPLAIPLGILIGILSLVPYLHSLGLIPVILLSLMKAADTGHNFWIILLGALAVFLCVQVIQDMILTPRIMGKAVGLPPFLILLALSVWGYLLGIIGMIIALPLTTLLISYYKRYIIKDDIPSKLSKKIEKTNSTVLKETNVSD